jgi:acyl-CoA thioesterase FadM
MRSNGGPDIAATTILTAVHLDTKARKACAFPPGIRSKAQGLASPAAG